MTSPAASPSSGAATSPAASPFDGAAARPPSGARNSVPTFLGSPLLDALTHVTAELAAELWVVKRRLALLEQHLNQRDGIDLDSVRFDDDQAQANAAAAAEFAERVFKAMQELTPPSDPAPPNASYAQAPAPELAPELAQGAVA